MSIDFSPLIKSLNGPGANHGKIRLWIRDDDAISVTPELERLARWALAGDAEILLAVVPAFADEGLARFVADHPCLVPGVHGWAHKNYAGQGEKKSEFGMHRPAERIDTDLNRGHSVVNTMFAGHALPVFVPPWNRVAGAVADRLSGHGFRALSAFGGVFANAPPDGLKVINTHLDIIDWKGTRGCRPHRDLVSELASLINKGGTSPIGVLTHHLVHDEACWDFLDELAAFVLSCPAIEWATPQAIIAQE